MLLGCSYYVLRQQLSYILTCYIYG